MKLMKLSVIQIHFHLYTALLLTIMKLDSPRRFMKPIMKPSMVFTTTVLRMKVISRKSLMKNMGLTQIKILSRPHQMQIYSLLHEHVDNHSCTRFLQGNVDNEHLTNPHEVDTKGQLWGLEKVHFGMINDIGQNDLETNKRTFS